MTIRTCRCALCHINLFYVVVSREMVSLDWQDFAESFFLFLCVMHGDVVAFTRFTFSTSWIILRNATSGSIVASCNRYGERRCLRYSFSAAVPLFMIVRLFYDIWRTKWQFQKIEFFVGSLKWTTGWLCYNVVRVVLWHPLWFGNSTWRPNRLCCKSSEDT